MTGRIGLYGGSFNPIHCGHLIVSRAMAERLGLERVILLPSARPPHKLGGDLIDGRHRSAMVKLAIEGDPLFELSDHDLARKGLSYTVETVAHFASEFGADVELYWIIGADSLAELRLWHQVDVLVDSCRIVTAARAGWESVDWAQFTDRLQEDQIARLQAGLIDTPVIEISSTDIRDRVARGRSIRHLVPEGVEAYIHQHSLYRELPRNQPECSSR